ncbi:hypothetical protein H0H93_010491, partial [Arthromyces matolae]
MRASYILTTIILLSISVANTSPLPGIDLNASNQPWNTHVDEALPPSFGQRPPRRPLSPSFEHHDTMESSQPTEKERILAQGQNDDFEQARKAALKLWPLDHPKAYTMANLVAAEMTQIGDIGPDAWKEERKKNHSSLEWVDTEDYKRLANAVGLDKLTQKPKLNDALPPSFRQ